MLHAFKLTIRTILCPSQHEIQQLFFWTDRFMCRAHSENCSNEFQVTKLSNMFISLIKIRLFYSSIIRFRLNFSIFFFEYKSNLSNAEKLFQNMKLPLILIWRPPSHDVSEVNKGKGVLDWSKNTLIESISTPRRSHTADIASLQNMNNW